MTRRAALCLLALAACERADPKPPEKVTTIPAPRITITVDDPGREPRYPLRGAYHASGHARFRIVENGRLTDGRSSSQTYLSETTLVEIDQGLQHWRWHTTAEPAPTVAVTVDEWTDTRGVAVRPIIVHGDIKDPESRHPELRTAFPEEAVGAGARWRERVEEGRDTSTVDVELLEVTPERVKVKGTFYTHAHRADRDMTHEGSYTSEQSLLELTASTLHLDETAKVYNKTREITGTDTLDFQPIP